MELTPEQKASVDQWNGLGAEIIDSAMHAFIPSWFTNVRSLIKADFPMHSVKELAERLHGLHDTFTVLGSGPSAFHVCKRLPLDHGAIFCGPTALGALQGTAALPTALIVADSNPVQYTWLKESNLRRPDLLDVVLPVTADPSWYASDSVVDRSRLYFFLPYLEYFGDTDIGFNHVLKSLLPEVGQYITQAGSVSGLALNFADWCCGESPEKRLYVGVDCSWPKGGPYRAPLPPGCGLKLSADWLDKNRVDAQKATIDVPFGTETLQTDLISIGYAIQLFYLIHNWTQREYSKDRYAFIIRASRLYTALAPKLSMPYVFPQEIELSSKGRVRKGEESWAYKVLLALIELSNTLQNRLAKEQEAANAKAESPTLET